MKIYEKSIFGTTHKNCKYEIELYVRGGVVEKEQEQKGTYSRDNNDKQ